MKSLPGTFLLAGLLVGTALVYPHPMLFPQAQSRAVAARIPPGTEVRTELRTSLDTRRAKPGKRVELKVTKDVEVNGERVIRKGAKITGHVVSAAAGGKGRPQARLELRFDRYKEGRSTVMLHAVVTDVSIPVTLSSPPMMTPGSSPQVMLQSPEAILQPPSVRRSGSDDANSLFTLGKRDIKLPFGTKLMLRVVKPTPNPAGGNGALPHTKPDVP